MMRENADPIRLVGIVLELRNAGCVLTSSIHSSSSWSASESSHSIELRRLFNARCSSFTMSACSVCEVLRIALGEDDGLLLNEDEVERAGDCTGDPLADAISARRLAFNDGERDPEAGRAMAGDGGGGACSCVGARESKSNSVQLDGFVCVCIKLRSFCSTAPIKATTEGRQLINPQAQIS